MTNAHLFGITMLDSKVCVNATSGVSRVVQYNSIILTGLGAFWQLGIRDIFSDSSFRGLLIMCTGSEV